MLQNTKNYYTYHCITKCLERIRLFQDDEDRNQFLQILAKTCIDLEFALFAFDIIFNHAHFLVGNKWLTNTKPDQNSLYQQMKYFMWMLNRRYGIYFREKYHVIGGVFVKNKEFFKFKPFPADFQTAMRYVQNNACSINKYAVFEDNPFSSYNYYVSAYVKNAEFQNLPIINKISRAPESLNIYNAMDQAYAISQFGDSRSMRSNFIKFLNIHHNALVLRDNSKNSKRATNRYSSLGIEQLLMNPSLLHIEKTNGHIVKDFVQMLTQTEIHEKNQADVFHTFSAFFPWHKEMLANNSDDGLKNSFSRIRKEYKTDFDLFIREITKKTSISAVNRIAGVNREYVRNQVRE